MKIIQKELGTTDELQLSYPLETLSLSLEELLFFDIETTGFLARSSSLYLIGCVYCENEIWKMKQWFAQTPEEESDILTAFLEFALPYAKLIHFNGNRFDLPYLKEKSKYYGLEDILDQKESLDLYRAVAPYKNILQLENCKQKSIEAFLGLEREDTFTGGELIDVYKSYVKEQDEDTLRFLLLHNADDILGLLQITPILFYHDFFESVQSIPPVQYDEYHAKQLTKDLEDAAAELPLRVVRAGLNTYLDFNQEQKTELVLKFQTDIPFPVTVHAHLQDADLQLFDVYGSVRVPLYEGELKYFYSNYKEYYYLPMEDQAMHKSVAKFVDKEHRVQAKAETCYTRKSGQFLPQWDAAFLPLFKEAYKGKNLYFELSGDIKTNRQVLSLYALHIVSHILDSI